MSNQECSKYTIPQYYSGKKLFITGGTGFIGKVLLENFLRFCPDISKIYLLIRSKKDKSPEQRLKEMFDLPLFDRLKKEYPENVKKVVPVVGDTNEIDLGLSNESRKLLIGEVNLVIHCAASVRFDDSLQKSILLNTRGTKDVALLAKEIKNIENLVHVSTTYCHTDKKVVEEKVYPAVADWREAIKIAENADSHTIDVLTAKYIEPFPNTYTFAKNLAEQVVTDLCDGKIPTTIFRPSIVISSYDEPIPGWIDNFNGPVGILVASGKGILKTAYASGHITADYVPVDIITKGLIAGVWKKSFESHEEKLKISVYNGSNNDVNNLTLTEMLEMGKKLTWEYPLNDVLWYPSGKPTSCFWNYYFRVMLYHILPALLVDTLLWIIGHKPMLLRIQRKIYIANVALHYFTSQEWSFKNDKSISLEENLTPEDRKVFNFHRDADPYEYFKNALLGSKEYLLKEDNSNIPKAKAHMRRLYVLSIFADVLWYLSLFYIVFIKYDLFHVVCNKICGYIDLL
ncbi:fatty acyl-CoA reductase wat-like [Sitophilus oryzae]|uniref:Fatty acyl-CoA reductase n=1 Tax=Sitophilus oryzae TaxID=7048 RepID=A0A6J2Y0W9_SITOR|nr:fatty acyl-CoA reductase wat-like [Sitophilus oryzae]